MIALKMLFEFQEKATNNFSYQDIRLISIGYQIFVIALYPDSNQNIKLKTADNNIVQLTQLRNKTARLLTLYKLSLWYTVPSEVHSDAVR